MGFGSWKGNSEGMNGVWVLEGEWRGWNNGGEWDLGPGRGMEMFVWGLGPGRGIVRG